MEISGLIRIYHRCMSKWVTHPLFRLCDSCIDIVCMNHIDKKKYEKWEEVDHLLTWGE